MKKDFFNSVKVPDFLLSEFEKEDWYLIIRRLKEILNTSLSETAIKYNSATLVTKGKVQIGHGCIIGDYTVIEGPAYIGNNVEIGPHVYIRPGSVISDNCVVGHASEVKNAVMMEGSKISNHVFLGDSIMGVKSRMGGHCESANRKFDQSEISLTYKDKVIITGLDKYGMILGEESRLGGSVMIAPGSMIGLGTHISMGLSISGYIPPNKFVKSKIELKVVDNIYDKGLHNKSKLFE